jgi:lipoate-protein ligase A
LRQATESWRLIDSGPCHPYYNMALDETLMRTIGGGGAVRFYSWEPPALSLGYFQSAGVFDTDDLAARGIVLVRRPTGGGAIYHFQELTFAVIAGPRALAALGPDTESRYARIHGAVIAALREFGVESRMRGGGLDPPFSPEAHRMCFDRTIGCDIVANGRKLAGSAQRRTPRGFLQHGSIPLWENPMTPGASWVNALSSSEVSFESLARMLARSFEEILGASLVPGEVAPREEERAQALVLEKYSTEEWNLKR